LPATTVPEVAACISCWKEADVLEFLALLYASNAVTLCGGELGLGSILCSQGGCAALFGPTPEQGPLAILGSGTENACQRGLVRAGIEYALRREQRLATCARAGGTAATCLADPAVQAAIAQSRSKQMAAIAARCGGSAPAPVPGPGELSWWSVCPLRRCGGYPVTTIDELATCVGDKADELTDGLTCVQFPGGGWSCPSSPSGAFIDGWSRTR
jgi:hypothetical protein